MPAFYILVMDQYRNDPDSWLYSASASSEAALQNTACYRAPPWTAEKQLHGSELHAAAKPDPALRRWRAGRWH